MENIRQYLRNKFKDLRSPKEKTFQTLFDLIHDQNGRIFCQYFDFLTPKSVTYEECKNYCYKTASFLKNNLKSPKGSFIGLMMENSLTWITVFWGLLMIGYKPILLNCKLTPSINSEILKILNANEVVTSKDFINSQVNTNYVCIEKDKIDNSNPIKEFDWEDEIALCTTASSLNYKICVYGGENIYHQLFNAEYIVKKYCPSIKTFYKGSLKLLAFLPFYHIFGLFATYFWFALFGRTIVFLKDYASNTIINTIRFFNVTHIFSVPLFWNSIAKEITKQINNCDEKLINKFKKGTKLSLKIQNIFPFLGRKIAKRMMKQIVNSTLGPSVKFLISGGGYLSNSTLKLFNSLGYPLTIGYGTSEIGIICFENRIKPKYRLTSSCGKPLKTIEVKLQDETLWVRGISTCKYFYYKDGTRVDLNGNWFDTKDIAKIDEKGYIYILGRKDDVIIQENGEKINPDLIEKLFVFTTVENFVVSDIDGKVSLIVQIKQNTNPLDTKNILKEINNNVSTALQNSYQIDRIYFTTDQLAPKNAIKVSRKILKTQLENKKIQLFEINELKSKINQSHKEICNSMSLTIRKIVSDVKNIDENMIHLDSHLIFDLHLNSLDYFTLLIKLEKEFDVKFIFKDKILSTINNFVDYIVEYKRKQ